jgi:hypothetical protein
MTFFPTSTHDPPLSDTDSTYSYTSQLSLDSLSFAPTTTTADSTNTMSTPDSSSVAFCWPITDDTDSSSLASSSGSSLDTNDQHSQHSRQSSYTSRWANNDILIAFYDWHVAPKHEWTNENT